MKSPKALAPSVTALAAVTALVLTACGPEDDAEFEDNGNGEETEQTSETEDTDDADPDDEQDAEDDDGHFGDDEEGENGEDDSPASGDVTVSSEDASETITYAIQGDTVQGEITMGMHGLEVGDQGMLLTVSFVPEFDGDDPVSFQDDLHSGEAGGNWHYLLPVVSDRENFKSYHVPVANPQAGSADEPYYQGWVNYNRTPWASSMDVEVYSGETVVLWAYYPAPEDDVDTLDVAVVPGVQEFKNVEVDWGDQQPAGSQNGDTDESAGEDEAEGDDDDEPVQIDSEDEDDA